MGARDESKALGYYLARPRRCCQWASTAVCETARVLLYRRAFLGQGCMFRDVESGWEFKVLDPVSHRIPF